MEAVERARELATEHGREAGEAWIMLHNGPGGRPSQYVLDKLADPHCDPARWFGGYTDPRFNWPEPDLSGPALLDALGYGKNDARLPENRRDRVLTINVWLDAYSAAFRDAVTAVVRERCEGVTR